MRQPFVLHHDFVKNPVMRLGCFSDLHHDHPAHDKQQCDRDFEEAANLDCRILINGDISDLIFSGDPRYTAARDDGAVDAVINRALKESANRLTPYADHIDMIGVGNHEASLLKHRGVDFVGLLINELNHHRSKAHPPIYHGGYRGFFRVQFHRANWSGSQVWYYDHGRGGSSPVTKGMIDISRLMKDWSADVYWLGHKHNSISDDDAQCRHLNARNRIVTQRRLAFYTAGYASLLQSRDYDSDGFVLDYAEERFNGTSSQGNAIVSYTHSLKSYISLKGSRTQTDSVRRRLEKSIEIIG